MALQERCITAEHQVAKIKVKAEAKFKELKKSKSTLAAEVTIGPKKGFFYYGRTEWAFRKGRDCEGKRKLTGDCSVLRTAFVPFLFIWN